MCKGSELKLIKILDICNLQALMLYRIAHRLWRADWRYAARALSFLARFVTNVDIHPGAVIGRRFFIDHGCGVVRFRANPEPLKLNPDQLTWDNLEQNREKWLRLRDIEEVRQWL